MNVKYSTVVKFNKCYKIKDKATLHKSRHLNCIEWKRQLTCIPAGSEQDCSMHLGSQV